ncbi:TAFII28-like protein, partial [Phakopsora pachyrhizi]
IRILLENFDPQQMDRYTEYRNSGLAKANVKKLANVILQQSVSDRVTVVTRGLAKVFVGHMVEKALEVQRRRGGSGPLTAYDLKEAYRAHLAERDRGGSDRRKMFCK